MIDPDKLTDLADRVQSILDEVDAIVPPYHPREGSKPSRAAEHQRSPLISAGAELEEAARHLRAASSPAPLVLAA